jgi:hypothetical protein
MFDLYAIKGNEVIHLGRFFKTVLELSQQYADFIDNGWTLDFIRRTESEEVLL